MTQTPASESASATANTNTLTPAMQQQLEQLRDIHLPEAVSWFPMAIGWWVLIALIILALVLIYRKVQAHRRVYKHPVYLSALDELSQLKVNAKNDNAKLAGDLSALLKRVGIYLDLSIDSLSEEAWAQYLSQNQPNQNQLNQNNNARFSKAQADFIANGAYINYDSDNRATQSIPNWQQLQTTSYNWITEQFRQSLTPTKKKRTFKRTLTGYITRNKKVAKS